MMQPSPSDPSLPSPLPVSVGAASEDVESLRQRRRRAAEERLIGLGWEPLHSDHVCALALQLFDSLLLLHGMDANDRDMLEVAALLHDIGWTVGEKRHHKHTLQLVRAVPLAGFTSTEQLIVANVARYHRRSFPRPSHRHFASLAPENQERVRRLAALLRVADGLDRRHLQVVRELRAEDAGRRVIIHLWVRGDARREILAASMKADLFRHAYGRELRFTTVHDSTGPPPGPGVEGAAVEGPAEA